MSLEGLLASMGALQGKLPSASAALTIELWRNSRDEHEVRVLYRQNAGSKFRHILVSGCRDLACPLADFAERSAAFIPEDWEGECGLIKHQTG